MPYVRVRDEESYQERLLYFLMIGRYKDTDVTLVVGRGSLVVVSVHSGVLAAPSSVGR